MRRKVGLRILEDLINQGPGVFVVTDLGGDLSGNERPHFNPERAEGRAQTGAGAAHSPDLR